MRESASNDFKAIQRRIALVDPDKTGLAVTVFVSIETGDHSQDWLKRFDEVVGAMPEVIASPAT